MEFSYIEAIYDRVVQEGYKNVDDLRLGAVEWRERVNNDPKFNVKIMSTMGIDVYKDAKDFVDINTELWFNGVDPVCVNHSMVDRHLMEGNKGPQVSCMGSVLWIGDFESRLYKEGIGKLVPLLRKIKYTGPISLHSIVTKDKVLGFNVMADFGYNTIFVLLEMYKGRVSDLLYGIAKGSITTMEFKAQLGIGVDLSVLPFPVLTLDKIYDPVQIEGLNKFNLKHFWGYDIIRRGDKYFTNRRGGRIGTVTARGDNIAGFSPLRDAKRRVMRTVNNLTIPGVMYRLDIGNRVESDKAKLHSWGWI